MKQVASWVWNKYLQGLANDIFALFTYLIFIFNFNLQNDVRKPSNLFLYFVSTGFEIWNHQVRPENRMEDSGFCEAFLFSLALLLWFYSFLRLYKAWQRVLNFSESSTQSPPGWDVLVNWILERVQVSTHNLTQPLVTLIKCVGCGPDSVKVMIQLNPLHGGLKSTLIPRLPSLLS